MRHNIRDLLIATTLPCSFFDSGLNLVAVNEAGLKEYFPGAKKENLLGKNLLELAPAIKDSGQYDKFLEVLRTGKPYLEGDVVIHPDFGERHFNIHAFKVDEGLGFIFTDITERKLAEEALRESEAKYRDLVERANDGVIIVQDGIIKFANRQITELTGYPVDELINTSLLNYISRDSKIMGVYTKRLQGKPVPDVYETFVWHKDGRKIYVEINSGMITYRGASAVFTFVRDITERKLAEEALRESEAKYRLLFETSADGILIADIKTRQFKDSNPAMRRMLGYSEEELAEMKVDQIHPRESLEHIISEFEAQARGEKTLVPNIPCLRKDGTIIRVDVNTSTTLINGRPSNVGIFRDVTERKQAEMVLRVQRDLGVALSSIRDLTEALTCILDVALTTEGVDSGGVYLVDSENGALNLLTQRGLSPSFVKAVSHFAADSPNARLVMDGKPFYLSHKELVPLMDEARRSEGLRAVAVIPIRYEDLVLAAFNLASHSRDEISPGASDKIEAIAAFIGSSVARIQAEDELRKAKKILERQYQELQTLDKMKDGLLSDVTHELKTPIAKHLMQVELLKRFLREKGLLDECGKIISVMETALERQENDIRNILDLSRLEKGGRKYTLESARLDLILEDILEGYRSTMEAHGVEVKKALETVTIITDRAMLFHVFSNIINNAIKFRRENLPTQIVISVEADGKLAVVRVADNGIGLTKEEQGKIFERFYQASASVPGSGVGLTIARMIVEGLGGKIRLESAGKDKGTTAIVELPVNNNC